MSSLKEYIINNNIKISEGHSGNKLDQRKLLTKLVSKDNIKNILEIGFNAGHSSELFLSQNNNVNVVSFDVGYHDSVKLCKKFIDQKYPNRHKLIIGNSLETIPNYNENIKFDLFFIDGGHDYNTAKNDIINCKRLSHENSIVVMDDVVNNRSLIKRSKKGPNKAWDEVKRLNIVKEIGFEDYGIGNGTTWGYYL